MRGGLIETWDVLKSHFHCNFYDNLISINRNMGCIEIFKLHQSSSNSSRLIETWDVLKLFRNMPSMNAAMINRNMGCIEICQALTYKSYKDLINRNMGCIEITLSYVPILWVF